ncbi:MAG TPA: type II toxin-antitoxin system HicA family toxin [Stellaceae bacterium]|nr:type II toxin-antitoxin system HicA family toxin [Stellaceae bacterium]
MDRSSRAIIKALEVNGWVRVNTEGSHTQFKHPTKPGRVTVPHPVKDLKTGTLKSIERQSGVKLT